MPNALLSNGRRIYFDEGTAPETIRNAVERAEARLASQAPAPVAPEAPTEPTNMFGGTPLLDRFGLKGLREGASSALGTETPIPAFVGRGALSRNPLIGGADLATALFNISSRAGARTPNDPNATLSDVPIVTDAAPQLDPSQAPATGAPIQLPYPSQVIGEGIGLQQQGPDTSMAERIAESIISFGRGNMLPSRVPGGRVPLSTNPATGARAASPMVQRAAGATGQVLGGTGAVIGSDIGTQLAQAAGIDPEIGAILGGITGGTGPSVLANTAGKLAAQHALADRGPGGTFWSPNQATQEAVALADQTGVTPSAGLVGNRSASRLENTAAGIPLIGNVTEGRQRQQFRQFQGGLYGQTEALGGTPGQEAVGRDILGDRLKLAAQRGERNIREGYNRDYAEVDRQVPEEALVQPWNTYTTGRELMTPGSGEGGATRAGVEQTLRNLDQTPMVTREVDPQPPAINRPVDPETGLPIPETETGILYRDARPAATEMFYRSEGQNPMSGGATTQLRTALNEDIGQTILNDPRSVARNPDLATREALVERLRVLARQYGQENATDTVGTGAPMVHPQTGELLGGGAFPILERIQNAPDERSAYTRGSQPGAMEVLQRSNTPENYGALSGDIIAQQSQTKTPLDDINVSPVVFSTWWNQLGPNERMIFANDRPEIVAELNQRAQMGERFRQRSFTANTSNTSPMMSTVGAILATAVDPVAAVNKGLAAAAAAAGVSSDTLARFLARSNPQALGEILRRGVDAARASAGTLTDYRGAP